MLAIACLRCRHYRLGTVVRTPFFGGLETFQWCVLAVSASAAERAWWFRIEVGEEDTEIPLPPLVPGITVEEQRSEFSGLSDDDQG